MKVTIDTQTTWDLMITYLAELDRINYDLDSPDWYWLPNEWTRFRAKKVVVTSTIDKISRKLGSEEYPSCVCSS